MVKNLPDVSNFQVLKEIGYGTFSRVFKVKEITTGKLLAVKKIWTSPDPKCEEFIHEIKALTRLKSKYVIEIEYFSVRFKRLYIFTSLHKDNLSTLIRTYKKLGQFLPINMVQFIMVQLISAIRYCHRKDIIHRDIKPDNLVINERFLLRLADFGSSLDIRKKPLRNIKFATTYAYAAPEICLDIGMDSLSQDIFSIGCVFAELLTNEQLFPMNNTSELRFISIYKIIGLPTDEEKIIEKLTSYKMDFDGKSTKTLSQLCGYEENSNEIKLLKSLLNPNYRSRVTLRDALTYDFFCQLYSVTNKSD